MISALLLYVSALLNCDFCRDILIVILLSYQGNSSWKREEGYRDCSTTKDTGIWTWEDLSSDSHPEHGWRFADKGRSPGESQSATGEPALFIFSFGMLVYFLTSIILTHYEGVVWKRTSLRASVSTMDFAWKDIELPVVCFLLYRGDIVPRTLFIFMNSVLGSVIIKIGQHSKFGFWARAGGAVIYFGRQGQAGGTTWDFRKRNSFSKEEGWWLWQWASRSDSKGKEILVLCFCCFEDPHHGFTLILLD